MNQIEHNQTYDKTHWSRDIYEEAVEILCEAIEDLNKAVELKDSESSFLADKIRFSIEKFVEEMEKNFFISITCSTNW